jgi:hypothetical protein
MAGTVVVTSHEQGRRRVRRIVLTCTADAAAATFPATVIPAFEGRIVEIRTNPGAVAPTDNYDITLVDADGIDRLRGTGVDRDTANSEAAPVVFSGTSINPVVDLGDVLTLTIANNAVNSAVIVVNIEYAPV